MLNEKCDRFGTIPFFAQKKPTPQKEEKGTTEMVGWHHRLSGHEFEQTPGDSEGLGSLACDTPWGHKESDVT